MSKPYDQHKSIELPTLTLGETELAKRACRRFVESLDRARAVHIHLADDEGNVTAVPIPLSALGVVAEALDAMGRGKAATLLLVDRDMSVAEAANFLNVSKPFVIQHMESGELPSHKDGSQRRVMIDDLVEFRARVHSKQHMALDDLARIGDELDLGD